MPKRHGTTGRTQLIPLHKHCARCQEIQRWRDGIPKHLVDTPGSVLIDLSNPHLIAKHEHVWPLVEEMGFKKALKQAKKAAGVDA